MYEQVFNFRSRPFTTTPFVKHYFAGSTIEQSLGQARLCIDRASGPVVLVGDIGTGKSLFLAMLEEHYKAQFQVINLGCARLENRKDLLQSILFALERPVVGRTEAELRFDLMALAKPSQNNPNGMILLVDDADSLSAELIDELRLITNYVVDGVPRVRLVMAGRQALEDLLSQPKFASFEQRIATRCYLMPLNQTETADYVNQHIERAGVEPATIFDVPSLMKIHELTQGVPRLINQVADFALIIAGTRGEQPISSELIEEAWSDVQSIPGLSPSSHSNAPTESTNPNGDWTVIEFGQLSDEGEGQVYEFGSTPAPVQQNNTPESPSLQLPTGQPPLSFPPTTPTDEVVGQAESNLVAENTPPTTPEPPASSIDPELGELGIDLAALQQLQAAAPPQSDTAQNSGASEADSEQPTVDVEPTNELGRNSISAVPDEEALEKQKQEMAAQFAAVFGTEVALDSVAETSPSETASRVLETPTSETPVGQSPELEPPTAGEFDTTDPTSSGDATPESQFEFTPDEIAHNQALMEQQENLLDQVVAPQASVPDETPQLPLDARDFLSRPQETDEVSNDQSPLNVSDFVSRNQPSDISLDAAAESTQAAAFTEAEAAAFTEAEAEESDAMRSEPADAANQQQSSDLPIPAIEGIDIAALTAGLEAARAFDQSTQPPQAESTASEESVTKSATTNVEEPIATESPAETASEATPLNTSEPFRSVAEQNVDNEAQETIFSSVPSVPTNEQSNDPQPEATFQQPNAEQEVVASEPVASSHEDETAGFLDPFAESFEHEETLRDRFAPIIAAQNHSSTELRSSDLAYVQPLDQAADESPSLSGFESSNGSDADPVDLNQASPETQASSDLGSGSELGSPSSDEPKFPVVEAKEFGSFNPIDFTKLGSESATGPAPLNESTELTEGHEQTEPATVSEDQANAGIESESIATPATAVIRPAHAVPSAQTPAPAEQPVAEQSVGSPNETVQDEHRHITEAANEEISRQAEAILQRLKASQAVSHETHVNTNLDENPNRAEESSTGDPTEAILDQIRQQSEMLKQVQTPDNTSDEQATIGMQSTDQTIDNPPPTSAHQDDSEMIVVSRNADHQPSPQPERPIELPTTPVSSGRAQRMDYQKLFDQLRNVDSPEPTDR